MKVRYTSDPPRLGYPTIRLPSGWTSAEIREISARHEDPPRRVPYWNDLVLRVTDANYEVVVTTRPLPCEPWSERPSKRNRWRDDPVGRDQGFAQYLGKLRYYDTPRLLSDLGDMLDGLRGQAATPQDGYGGFTWVPARDPSDFRTSADRNLNRNQYDVDPIELTTRLFRALHLRRASIEIVLAK